MLGVSVLPCKIAILDSGIDLENYESHVMKYIEYTEEPDGENIYDSNGHGTLCCSVMLSVNSDIQFIIIKILNEKNLCSDERLIRALNYLKEVDVDIINLSLSTDSWESSDRYRKVIAELVDQGKVIVAATTNGNKDSLLSNLNGTIGIYGNLFNDPKDYWYQKGREVQCVANSMPYLYKGMQGQYEMFGGNSKATALFSGIVSLHWGEIKNCSWRDKECILERYAQKCLWTKEEIVIESQLSKEQIKNAAKDDIYIKVTDALAEQLNVSAKDVINPGCKHLYELGVTRYNAFEIVKAVEEETGINLPYSQINLSWFYSIDSLCNNIRIVKKGLEGL